MKEQIKKWLVDQVEAAKVAWTVIVVVAGVVYGYKADLVPIDKGTNAQQTIEKRLSTVEKQLQTDKHVNLYTVEQIEALKAKIAKDLEELQNAVTKGAKEEVKDGASYVVPAPKVPE